MEIDPGLAPFLHFAHADATGNLPNVVLKPRKIAQRVKGQPLTSEAALFLIREGTVRARKRTTWRPYTLALSRTPAEKNRAELQPVFGAIFRLH